MKPYHGVGAGWAVASMKSFGSRSAASLMILQNHLPATELWRSWTTVAHRGMKVWLAENNPLTDKKAGPAWRPAPAPECLSDQTRPELPESGVDLSLKATSLLHFVSQAG